MDRLGRLVSVPLAQVDVEAHVGDLLGALAALERAQAGQQPDGDDHAQQTDWAWLPAAEAVRVAHLGDRGHGLVATRALAAGDEVLRVPEGEFLSVAGCGRASLQALAASSPLLRQIPSVALALLVAAEYRDPQSRFRAYLRSLPRPDSFSIPLCMSGPELLALRGSAAFVKALRLLRSTVQQYLYLREAAEAGVVAGPWTWRLYKWAVCVAMTRQNAVPQGLALIPLWDLLNHEQGAGSTEFADGAIRFTVNRAFAEGEEVLMHYGDRDDVDMLLYSGFVPANNPHRYVTVRVCLPPDPLLRLRVMQLARRGVVLEEAEDGMAAEVRVGPGGVAEELWAVARIAGMAKADLAALMRDPDAEPSEAVQAGARAAVRELVEYRLSAYPSPAPSPPAPPSAPAPAPDSWPMRCARALVASEQEMLGAVLSSCS